MLVHQESVDSPMHSAQVLQHWKLNYFLFLILNVKYHFLLSPNVRSNLNYFKELPAKTTTISSTNPCNCRRDFEGNVCCTSFMRKNGLIVIAIATNMIFFVIYVIPIIFVKRTEEE
jgi:hypothetical protein